MKKIISIIICFIMMLSIAACGTNDYIGIDKAKQTVVDDIGAAVEDVEFAVNDLITDDNGDYYKLHFTKDGTEYIYEVDAMTGKIINKSSNSTDTNDNMNQNSSMESTSNNTDNLLDNNDMTGESNNNGAMEDNMNNTSTTSM